MRSLLVLIGLLISLTPAVQAQPEALRQEVLLADRAFSDRSAQVGINKALLEWAADSACLLRPGHAPIVGRPAITAFQGKPAQDFTLTWAPQGVDVALSGELAFTYGTYKLFPKKPGSVATEGTYVTIWRRKPGTRQWRFVLESGNEGLVAKP